LGKGGDVLDAEDIRRLVHAADATIKRHVDELTALDAAIGDADHGVNMMRGFSALAEAANMLAAKPFGEALDAAGKLLLMHVGGASGPLAATLLIALARNLGPDGGRETFPAAFRASVDAVAKRGKSGPGDKTVLDVLYPVAAAIEQGIGAGAIARIADDASLATIPVRARRGRAAFLGERSIGHMDPGARSAALLAGAFAHVREARL
jgi:phosphoenolpyruvate---glycerone phosphotransferase subunit DhaL